MLAYLTTGTVLGVNAYPVDVEVDVGGGNPFFETVGLPETAIKESRFRIEAALKNSGYQFPFRRVMVNLAPADIRKDGTGFDLPIALGIVGACGQMKRNFLGDYLVAGELSLTGEIKPIRGVLPLAVMAREAGKKGIILPLKNAEEAAVVKGITVRGVRHFSQVVEFFNGEKLIEEVSVDVDALFSHNGANLPDFSEVRGQEYVKRALEVAAAGGHNLLMIGPPGSGKTMLARRIPSILPSMTFEEALETTKIYSVSGLLSQNGSLITHRPFRAPHHTVSDVGLIGGGSIPKPGEVSLAHNGVLFLDELPEFKRHALEVLRQPLEDNKVTISRARIAITFPASIMLIAAMNPCPCGYLGDAVHQCVCRSVEITRYRSRISGPLLDRIDIHVEVPSIRYEELSRKKDGENSVEIRERVNKARRVQHTRFKESPGVFSNSQMTPRLIRKFCESDAEGNKILEMVVNKLGMSARAHDRILKVARTIADLDGDDSIRAPHIAEAVQYRSLDRSI
ncbi:MAG: YifB family Mg chelatase-like AAA ATPase [Myxococcota bacterium]